MISDSKVMEGSCIMLVCTVGENTYINKMRNKLSKEQPPTPLQMKLEDVANAIRKIGTAAAALTFLALMMHIIYNIFEGTLVFWSIETATDLINDLILAVTIIVVENE